MPREEVSMMFDTVMKERTAPTAAACLAATVLGTVLVLYTAEYRATRLDSRVIEDMMAGVTARFPVSTAFSTAARPSLKVGTEGTAERLRGQASTVDDGKHYQNGPEEFAS